MLFFLLLTGKSMAQTTTVLEEIIAVVGENVLLRSDLETEYLQMKTQYETLPPNYKCQLLEQLLMQQLMLHKAEVDSSYVSEDLIESELESRIRFYSQQIGGQAKLEKYLGKSIVEYKEEIRVTLEKQLRIQDIQQKMVRDIKVSPTDVRKFFEAIPKDSLPVFDAEVEVGQIVITPKPSTFAKEYAYNTINAYREDIMSGKRDFSVTARAYSDDIGSKQKGGELGYFERGQMLPTFEGMAFKLKKDSVSPVIETDFGYHILLLIDRKGEKINVRHILVKPKIVSTDIDETKRVLEKIASDIKKDSITFCQAAAKFSEDIATKSGCGLFIDPSLGSSRMLVTALEPDIALAVQSMEPGDISSPQEVANQDGTSSYRILYLKSEIEPHVADIKLDYQKLQAFALEKKKIEEMKKWATTYRKNTYVWIDESYNLCEDAVKWRNILK
jgi:peptidyl-prolyl cis-trans isomerase SurA